VAVKAYTMDKPGIRVVNGAVQLGDVGRGRALALVPVLGVSPEGETDLAFAKVGKDGDGRVAIQAQNEGDEERVLVLLNASGGWRGSVKYTLPEGTTVLCTGTIAQGDAGRAGGWDELLIIAPKGAEIEYSTSGGGGHIGGRHWLRVLTNTVVHEDEVRHKARLAREAAEMGAVQWL
jgi:hypothetical protein